MLTTDQQKDDAGRCRELGVADYLVKPVRKSELYGAILSALKLGPDTARKKSETLAANASTLEAGRPLHILLVEDTAINQKLATRILERRGHKVTLAKSGIETLAATEIQIFDLVLMDVQMPGMDGFEATANIRAREAVLGRRTPIVALTAHAMKGDRQRCLDAGMDGYVGKPINIAELLEEITRVSMANTRTHDGRHAESSDSQPGLDQFPVARSTA
jgi:CheY-like chemotaxis protein